MSIFNKIKNVFSKDKEAIKYEEGLAKTRKEFSTEIASLSKKYKNIDDDYFEELENILIMSDIGVNTVVKFVDKLKKRVKEENIKDSETLKEIIIDELLIMYVDNGLLKSKINYNAEGPTVVLFIGVNGVGKTTSIGKIANKLKHEGKKVLLVAADTFRAGAIEQLKEWGQRTNIDVVTTPDSDTVTLTSSNPFVMRLNKTGNKTWKMTAVDAGEATITATSSSGATISSVYTVSSYEYLGTSRMKKGCKSKITLNDVVIYRENGVSDSVYNAYLTDFKELPNYMKKGTKELYILTQATFNLYHNSGARGVTMSKQGYSIIDIRAEKYSSGCYNALPHEFAHAVDGRYKHVYGNGRISESKDWSNLYNYYKNHQGNVLWYNAYANKGEFFADSYAFYFMKYQAKTHTFNKSYYSNKAYPNNIKKQMYNTINFINNTSM